MNFRSTVLVAFIGILLIGCKNHHQAPSTISSSQYFDLNGSKIHYKVSGQGSENLLFIHGWGCDLNAWKYQEVYFRDKAKIILVDLPGFGKSSRDFENYSIEFFAETMIHLLESIGIEKVSLVGHSLGHPIAKKIAELDPKLVEKICIVDGVYFNFPNDDQKKIEYINGLEDFVSMFEGPDRQRNTKDFVNSLFISSTPQTVKNYTDTTMMRVPEEVGLFTMQNLIREEVWQKNPIDNKTLAVYANIPELPDNNDSILGLWYPNLDYHEMPNVGHFLMMEDPNTFNQILHDFIN